ncbi:MAG: hypothetical protein WCP23_11955, partial [Planctomycetota bacterium]
RESAYPRIEAETLPAPGGFLPHGTCVGSVVSSHMRRVSQASSESCVLWPSPGDGLPLHAQKTRL